MRQHDRISIAQIAAEVAAKMMHAAEAGWEQVKGNLCCLSEFPVDIDTILASFDDDIEALFRDISVREALTGCEEIQAAMDSP